MAPRKAAKPRPPIQVMARPLGHVEWICPDCGAMSGSEQIAWRKARVACRHCKHKFRIGQNFHTAPTGMPPHNALFMGEWSGGSVNTIGQQAGHPALGRLIGRIDWVCPNCSTAQCGSLGWDFGEVDCVSCGSMYWVRLLLYSSAQRIPISTPQDWVPLSGDFQNAARTKQTNPYRMALKEIGQE